MCLGKEDYVLYKCTIYYWNGWEEAPWQITKTIAAKSYAAAARELLWSTAIDNDDIEKIEIEKLD
jgi:hypothetical protein